MSPILNVHNYCIKALHCTSTLLLSNPARQLVHWDLKSVFLCKFLNEASSQLPLSKETTPALVVFLEKGAVIATSRCDKQETTARSENCDGCSADDAMSSLHDQTDVSSLRQQDEGGRGSHQIQRPSKNAVFPNPCSRFSWLASG